MWRGTWPHKAERQTDGVQDGVAWALRGKVEAPCSPYLWSSLSPRATAHRQPYPCLFLNAGTRHTLIVHFCCPTQNRPRRMCVTFPHGTSAVPAQQGGPEQTPKDVCALPSWDRCRSLPNREAQNRSRWMCVPFPHGTGSVPAQQEGHLGDESVPQELLQSPFEEPGPTAKQAGEGAPG